MLVDPYATLAAALGTRALGDALRDASTGLRKPSKLPALGLPYGRQLDSCSKQAR
jgi:hypothetical protein